MFCAVRADIKDSREASENCMEAVNGEIYCCLYAIIDFFVLFVVELSDNKPNRT